MKYVGKVFNGEKFVEEMEFSVVGDIISTGDGEKEELKGNYVALPGLIDSHMHFFGVLNDNLLEWNLTPEGLSTARSTLDMLKLLAAGFTTVRDLGSKAAIHLSLAEREGSIIGPRVIASGYSLAETGGNDDPRVLPLDIAQRLSYSFYCDSPNECRKAVRLAIRQGAEVIKVYASGGFSQSGNPKPALTVDDFKAIVHEAHRAGLKVAAHAYGEEAISNVVEASVDTIEHGLGITESLAKEIRRKGICYVPTLATYDVPLEISRIVDREVRKRREDLVKRHFSEDMRIAVDERLKIAAGTDFVGSPTRPNGMNYKEIVLLARYMPLEKALASATSVAAECLGIKGGRIENGYPADVAIFRSFNDALGLHPSNMVYVIRKGKLFSGENLRQIIGALDSPFNPLM
ncbi:amidohydrolase [Sulfolobales archaeon HS-7]|nr:amidohydrolase [Sulfolobales archaeon HS-7]